MTSKGCRRFCWNGRSEIQGRLHPEPRLLTRPRDRRPFVRRFGLISAFSLRSEQPRGQEKNCFQESEDCNDRNAHQAERKRDQPDEGIEHQDQERQRPTEEEKQPPENESDEEFHGILLKLLRSLFNL